MKVIMRYMSMIDEYILLNEKKVLYIWIAEHKKNYNKFNRVRQN